MLALQGHSAALAFLAITQLHRSPSAGIPRPAGQFPVVRLDAFLDIVRASHIQRAVCALNNVYEIRHINLSLRNRLAREIQRK
jgi:hypothetical protein